MRLLATAAAISLVAFAAYAADPKVESATKIFQSLATDPGKVKAFCEMSKVMEDAGENVDAAADTKIQSYMTQLGPDFQQAWNTGSELDENSEDGKVYAAALDTLSSKCS